MTIQGATSELQNLLGADDIPLYYKTAIEKVIETIMDALKREQPDEWCYECKEYDTEKKCCPRFNRVIRGTMNDIAKWRSWSHTYDNACMDGERSEE